MPDDERLSGDGIAGLPQPPPSWRPGGAAWSDALAAEILEVVATAPRSLEWLCATNPHWPVASTIHAWKRNRPEFRNAYVAAREALAEVLAFQAIEIADDDTGDMLELSRKDGSKYAVVNAAKVQRDKLRTENRRWLAGKLAPEVYGERFDATVRLGPILSQEEALDQLR